MSMEIDFASPLTKDEREYLDSRGRYAEIERSDSLNGVETPESGSGDGTGLQQVSLMTSEQRASEADRLRARLAEIEGPAEEEDDEDVVPYEAMTVPALDAELKARHLPVTGSKPEKVKRLEEDDELAAVETQS